MENEQLSERIVCAEETGRGYRQRCQIQVRPATQETSPQELRVIMGSPWLDSDSAKTPLLLGGLPEQKNCHRGRHGYGEGDFDF